MDSGIVAELGADWMTKADAGTGPFTFKQWKRGIAVDLAANPGYWGGAPKIDGVQFLIVPTGDTALSQYDAGELDFVNLPENSFRRALSDPAYASQTIKVPKAQVRYIGMNQNLYAPFKDKRVREAISLSIDRDGHDQGPLQRRRVSAQRRRPCPASPATIRTCRRSNTIRSAPRSCSREAGFPDGKGMPPIEITVHRAVQGRDHLLRRPVQARCSACRSRQGRRARHLHQVDECRRGGLLPLGLDRRLSRRHDLPGRDVVRARARSTGRAGRTPPTTS